jgi:hypothetical protein
LLAPISTGRHAPRSTGSGGDGAFDPTVKFHSTPPPRVLSNEERRRLAASRQRRTVALVALSALLAGGLGAFFFARVFSQPVQHVAEPAHAPPPVSAQTVVVAPAPEPPHTSASPSAEPAAPTDTGEPRNKGAKPVHSGVPTQKPAAKPAESASAVPTGAGVAPGLTLKPY